MDDVRLNREDWHLKTFQSLKHHAKSQYQDFSPKIVLPQKRNPYHASFCIFSNEGISENLKQKYNIRKTTNDWSKQL